MITEKSLLAFSGGKDSVAVSQYMLNKGYKIPHIAIVNKELDYPKHIQFIIDYCRKYSIELHLINREKYGVKFLHENPKYIFPFDSKVKSRWYKIFQQNGVREFAEKYEADTVIFGRRRQDGNSIRKRFYRNKNGIGQFFPIMDWSNERTWRYVKGIPHSPIYDYAYGRKRGTHPINIANTYDGTLEEVLEFIKTMSPSKYKLACKLAELKQNNYV